MNKRIEVSMENSRSMERQISLPVRSLFFLKVQWMCISLGSLVESCDLSNLRAVLVWLMGLMLRHALWAQYGYIYTGNVYDCIPHHTYSWHEHETIPNHKMTPYIHILLQLSHFLGRKNVPVWHKITICGQDQGALIMKQPNLLWNHTSTYVGKWVAWRRPTLSIQHPPLIP